MRVFVAAALAAALLFTGFASQHATAGKVANTSTPGVPTANLWVSAEGSACIRSAAPLAYARALASGHVCDTFDRAYHAAAPGGGDVVRVKDGIYPGGPFTFDPSKNGEQTTFTPEKRYGVTLTTPMIFGPNVSYLRIKNFVVNSPKGAFLNSSFGFSRDITIEHNRINIGQKVDGTPAGIYFYSNIDSYKILDNVIGPSCCGWATKSSPLGIRIGKGNPSAPYANNVLIDGNTIQHVVRSCQYWPSATFGPCPDTSCRVDTCHIDAIQIWGIQNSTISNNRLYNDEVQGLFIEDAASAINSNMTITNNSVQVVGGGVGFNFKGISGEWTIAFNSSPNVMVLGYGFPVAAPGSTVTLLGNKAVLLMADRHGHDAGCRDGASANVELRYSYNVWMPQGGATSAVCGPTDLATAKPPYGGLGATISAFNSRNPHGSLPPPTGAAYYRIVRTRRGRVVAFRIDVDSGAPYTGTERLALLSRDELPADATLLRTTANCVIWKSARLKRLIRMRYAVATTMQNAPKAEMRGERRPVC
jgi:hypothetical protein